MPRPLSLSLDLLRTFELLVKQQGDAARTADELGINQASMSKRLKIFQHVGPLLDRPWLRREGRTWRLTDEGQRVLPAVEDIISRYERLTQFTGQPAEKGVKFACGQQAVRGFVRKAIREFRAQHPNTRLNVATVRGTARIEGVASGALDLATVTHDEREIHRIARRRLHVEALAEDCLMLACAEKAPWGAAVKRLPKAGVSAADLSGFPLILPGPDAGVRHWLDAILRDQGVLHDLEVVLETGGWATILAYVHDAFGVGTIADTAAKSEEGLVLRRLDPAVFPPRVTRLICRKLDVGGQKLDLTPEATAFRESLIAAVSSGA